MLRNQTVTMLIDYTRKPTPGHDELVNRFINLQTTMQYHIFTFWEAHETSLLGKVYLSWLFSRRAFVVSWVALFTSFMWYSFAPWVLVVCLLWVFGFRFYQSKQVIAKYPPLTLCFCPKMIYLPPPASR